jgi:hypothetical protein
MAIALLPASQRDLAKDYMVYSMEWLPALASPANTPASFTIDAQAGDFVALFVSGFVTDTASPPVTDFGLAATLQLKLAERTVFDKPVHWTNFVGSGVGPFPLPFPLYLPAATTLTGTITSFQTANRNARLSFHGFLLHTYSKTTSRGY